VTGARGDDGVRHGQAHPPSEVDRTAPRCSALGALRSRHGVSMFFNLRERRGRGRRRHLEDGAVWCPVREKDVDIDRCFNAARSSGSVRVTMASSCSVDHSSPRPRRSDGVEAPDRTERWLYARSRETRPPLALTPHVAAIIDRIARRRGRGTAAEQPSHDEPVHLLLLRPPRRAAPRRRARGVVPRHSLSGSLALRGFGFVGSRSLCSRL